ncbi:MAG: nitroreductase [Saprospiraceae bacterium]|nr:nitroreductase [Saprospiraceae bacterium]
MKYEVDQINDLIENRRAIFPKQFTEEPIASEVLTQLLENANWAPTHRRTEPWRFVVVRGEARARMGDILADLYLKNTPTEKYSERKHLKKASNPRRSAAIIAICMKRHEELLPEWEEIAATACAVQNLWLTATAYGLGGYWSSPSVIKSQEIRAFLELPEDQICLGFFYLGKYSSEHPKGQRNSIAEKVRWLND